jgi:hypothetical protein
MDADERSRTARMVTRVGAVKPIESRGKLGVRQPSRSPGTGVRLAHDILC